MAQATFAYVALDASGARRSGAVDADTKEVAIARLAAEGRYVLQINESKQVSAKAAGESVSGRAPSRQDLALFSRRLADLSGAGLPLDRVLQVVGEQSESAVLKEICAQALIDIRSGLQVSQALAKHPKYFNNVFTQTLRAGEASGQFSEVAERLANYQELEVTRRSQIVSALTYPALLAAAAVGVFTFLITFVIPRMSGIFEGLGTELPWSTRVLLALSAFLTVHWIAVLATIIIVVLAIRMWFATHAGATYRDQLLLTSPLIGPVIRKATVSRFARVLGTLIFGGVPILEALEIAGLSASNRIFIRSAKFVEEEVRAGRPVAEAMRDAGAFPPVLTHMVAVGEETGDLPKMLARVADSLDFEVDTGMRRVVALAEPTIILIMGFVVGFVFLSILLPIYQSQNLVK